MQKSNRSGSESAEITGLQSETRTAVSVRTGPRSEIGAISSSELGCTGASATLSLRKTSWNADQTELLLNLIGLQNCEEKENGPCKIAYNSIS